MESQITTKITIASIIVSNRLRIDHSNSDGLKESLHENGTIQPIVLTLQADNTYRLLAGGRRLSFLKELGHEFLYHGSVCDPLHPGFVLGSELPEDKLHELEIEENIKRKNMSWQERVLAIDTIHKIKKRQAALESNQWGEKETANLLGMNTTCTVNYARTIAAKLRAEMLPDQSVSPKAKYWNCTSLTDAYRLRMQEEEDNINTELAKRMASANGTIINTSPTIFPQDKNEEEITGLEGLFDTEESSLSTSTSSTNEPTSTSTLFPTIIQLREKARGGYANLTKDEARTLYLLNPLNPPEDFEAYHDLKSSQSKLNLTIPLSSKLFNVDCINFMQNNPLTFDHIITDPPYGIDMANLDQQNTGMENIASVEAEHTVEGNLLLLSQFFPAAYTCLKDNSFCIIWADQMLWTILYNCAIQAGFKVQRWPIVWLKSHRCLNQSGNQNFTKTTEIAMVCRKGNATMIIPGENAHIIAMHDEYKQELGHPFVKPFAVWEHLIKAVTMEGQTILEPFAGRGSNIISLIRLKRNFIGCEKDSAHYNALIENVKRHYLKFNPNFSFA
jgi:site-specific DNA-methyltransferase (adenine-specific)/modification methylase